MCPGLKVNRCTPISISPVALWVNFNIACDADNKCHKVPLQCSTKRQKQSQNPKLRNNPNTNVNSKVTNLHFRLSLHLIYCNPGHKCNFEGVFAALVHITSVKKQLTCVVT